MISNVTEKWQVYLITHLCKKWKLENSGTISLQSQKRISGKLTIPNALVLKIES